MNPSQQSRVRLSLENDLRRLERGTHACPIYESTEQQMAVALSFIRDGLAGGERCIYVTEDPYLHQMAEALAAAKVNVAQQRERGALQILPKQDVYLRGGTFAPQTMLDFLAQAESEALAQGYTGLRVLGVMTWALDPKIDPDRLVEYEILLNKFLETSRSIIFCQYSRPRFDPSLIHDILRLHPLAILGELVCPNPYYEPPDLVLRGEQMAISEFKEKRVNWWIKQLKTARTLEQEQERTASISRERDAFVRLLMNSTAEAIYGIDLDGNCTLVNPSCARLLGYEPGQLTGSNAHALLHHSHADGTPYPSEECPIYRTLRTGEKAHVSDEVFWRADGTPFYVEYWSHPVRRAGQLIGAVVTFLDISDRVVSERRVRQLSARILQAQDEERRRLARELHDTTAQSMAAITINLAQLENAPLSERQRQVLASSQELAQQSVQELRTFSYLLHPPMLDQVGLISGLKHYIEGFEKRSSIKVERSLPQVHKRLLPELELTIFRIVQESLSNIWRHSGSREAKINMTFDSHVRLEVSDTGHGFDVSSLDVREGSGSLGVGIAGMRERLQHLDGTLTIESDPSGTVLRANIPIRAQRHA